MPRAFVLLRNDLDYDRGTGDRPTLTSLIHEPQPYGYRRPANDMDVDRRLERRFSMQ
jgi:hypothetical protein